MQGLADILINFAVFNVDKIADIIPKVTKMIIKKIVIRFSHEYHGLSLTIIFAIRGK